MRKNQLIVLWVSVILLSMSSTLVAFSYYKISYIQDIPMDIKVSNYVGFNLDDDALHFGAVPIGGCGNRNISIEHKLDFPVDVVIEVIGDLEPWTLVEDGQFRLNPGEKGTVSFKVCPVNVEKDITYSGTARIIFKRV